MWQVPRRLPGSAAATTNQYALPHQVVSFHSSLTTSCTSALIHHPGFHCSLLPNLDALTAPQSDEMV